MTINLSHYYEIKETLGSNTSLCIVTKHHSKEDILSYYHLGERIFAENRAQELIKKQDLPSDIEWHFIGHLQKNKVRQVLPFLSCIQSLDSYELATLLDKECKRINKHIPVYAQFHLATEDTNKYGLSKKEAFSFFSNCEKLTNIEVCGMMVMGPHTDNTKRIQEVFEEAQSLFHSLQKEFPKLKVLSMGMSDDYEIALQCGSTMVRIGSYLFEGDK